MEGSTFSINAEIEGLMYKSKGIRHLPNCRGHIRYNSKSHSRPWYPKPVNGRAGEHFACHRIKGTEWHHRVPELNPSLA